MSTSTYACALITGASSGLGREFSRQLAMRSERLILVARRGNLLQELADEICAEFPDVKISTFATDLTDSTERVRFVADLGERGLVPDLLVNSAGMGDYGDFTDADWPKIEALLRLNIEALTHLTHMLLPGMIEQGSGAVLNVSSLASLLPIPDLAVYAASKAYVTSFSEALRIELREHGIPVIAVCPGPVHTGFGNVANREDTPSGSPSPEWFHEPKETVIAEALDALDKKRARVYPGLKTAVAAVAISVVPIVLLRVLMGFRPRKAK